MQLKEAYREIWKGKLETTQHPSHQRIDRVEWASELWLKHFGSVNRLEGPLLDCGTGSGAMLAKAASAGIPAQGVDFDGPLIGFLRKSGYKVTSCDLNAEKLPDGPFQIVTCCDVIEHVLDPAHLLAEMYRVMAPGAHCYVGTPNCAYWRRVAQLAGGEMFRTSGDNVLRDGGHVSYWAVTDLTAALRNAGFREIGIEYRGDESTPPRGFDRGPFSRRPYMIAWAVK